MKQEILIFPPRIFRYSIQQTHWRLLWGLERNWARKGVRSIEWWKTLYKACNLCELEEIGLLWLVIKGGGKRTDSLYDNQFDTYIGRLINNLSIFIVQLSQAVKGGTQMNINSMTKAGHNNQCAGYKTNYETLRLNF